MTQLITAPTDEAGRTYLTLGYVDAYDAVLDCDYAFVAYKETDSDGNWRVRIRSSQTAGAVFEPEAMRLEARKQGARGEPSFVWGYSFDPSPGDMRCIRFRVVVEGGKPKAIEMFVQLRKFDGTPDEPKSVSFDWPA